MVGLALDGLMEAIIYDRFFYSRSFGVKRSKDAPWMVAAWIGAAYWFTASTSFANPAITLARSLSDTFAGIRPADVPEFIAAQLSAAVMALVVARWMFSPNHAVIPPNSGELKPGGHISYQ
jgi:glycerol uptake facilitator-like aquaporin